MCSTFYHQSVSKSKGYLIIFRPAGSGLYIVDEKGISDINNSSNHANRVHLEKSKSYSNCRQ